MADTDNQEVIIKSLLLPLAKRTMLIANANVAEIISGFIVEQESTEPGILGIGHWRGSNIPFISLELLSNEEIAIDIKKANYAVFYSINPENLYEYYAVLLHGIPKFEFVNKDNSEDAKIKSSNDFFIKDILLNGNLVSIPDLNKLESLPV